MLKATGMLELAAALTVKGAAVVTLSSNWLKLIVCAALMIVSVPLV